MTTLKDFQNADGTYNGVALMSKVTDLSQAEIAWSFERMKHLLHVEKKTRSEAVAILKTECASRPWESSSD